MKDSEELSKHHKWLLAIFVVICLLVEVGAMMALYKGRLKIQRDEAKVYGESIASSIRLSMDKSIGVSSTLKYTYQDMGESMFKDFDRICSRYAKDNPTIGSMYIAPEAILRVAYPGSVNAATIGFEMLKDAEQGPKAQEAIETRSTTVSGPNRLIEGGSGFIIRNPLFEDGKFVAFSVIVLDWDRFVKQILTDISGDASAYHFAVWKENDSHAVVDRQGYIFKNTDADVDRGLDIPIAIANDTWHLTVEPAEGWLSVTDMKGEIVMSFALMICVVAFAYFFLVSTERRKRNILERHANEVAQERVTVIQSMGKLYYASYYVDVEHDSVTEFVSTPAIRSIISTDVTARIFMESLWAKLVKREFQYEAYKFFDLKQLDSLMEGKGWIHYDYIGVTQNAWSRMYVIPVLRDERGHLTRVLYCFQRIQEEKQKELAYQESLQQAMLDAQKANEAKSAFLFNMSHDIRTPMNAIVGFANLLEASGDDPEKRANFVSNIKVSCRYLLNLINNVLEMSCIESGKMNLLMERHDLNSVVHDLHLMFEGDYAKKHLVVDRDIRLSHTNVYCDLTKLQEIFMNIASNAVKYTPDGGKIYVSVWETPLQNPEEFLFTAVIEDTGVGISKEFLPKVFESFAREDAVTRGKFDGAGLGMCITKKLVELMGGTIQLESDLGRGTKVTVSIPLRVCDVTAPTASASPAVPKKSPFENKRVLLVEDNALNLEITKTFLEEAGIVVETAENGSLAVEMVKNAPKTYYNLILMDIMMPVMDGYEATRIIRSMGYETPVYAITANAFEEDKRRALISGMDGHITKPLDSAMLLEALHEVFG